MNTELTTKAPRSGRSQKSDRRSQNVLKLRILASPFCSLFFSASRSWYRFSDSEKRSDVTITQDAPNGHLRLKGGASSPRRPTVFSHFILLSPHVRKHTRRCCAKEGTGCRPSTRRHGRSAADLSRAEPGAVRATGGGSSACRASSAGRSACRAITGGRTASRAIVRSRTPALSAIRRFCAPRIA